MKRPPVWLGALLVALLTAAGWSAAQQVGQSPYQAADTQTIRVPRVSTITTRHVRVRTRLVRRVTRGRVITLPGGQRVVHVPLLIVHTRNRVIRVPAHNLPIRSVSPARAVALITRPITVTVTVQVPVTETVTVPTTQTVTVTVTSVATETTTVLSTVTEPITITEPQTSTADS